MGAALQLMQALFEIGCQARHTARQIISLQYVQSCYTRSTRDRMCRIGVTVGELQHIVGTALLHKRLVYLILCYNRAHGHRSIGELLGDIHNVGNDAEGLGPGHGTTAPKGCDDFIKNQQNIVGGTDIAQTLQITSRGRNDSGGTRHGLHDNGGDIGGVVQCDDFVKLIGQMPAVVGRAPGKNILREQRVRQVVCVNTLAKQLSIGGNSTDRNSAKINPVIALGTAYQFGLGRLALEAPVSPCHLQGCVGTFRARVCKENIIEAIWRYCLELIGQLKGLGVPELERGGIVQGLHLLVNRLGNLLAIVARARTPQT